MSRDGMTYQFIGLNIFISNLQYGWNDFLYKQPVYETVIFPSGWRTLSNIRN